MDQASKPFAELLEIGLAADPGAGGLWRAIRTVFSGQALHRWRRALAELKSRELGPAVLGAYVLASRRLGEQRGVEAALALAPATLALEQRAGRPACLALLEHAPSALRHLTSAEEFRDWLDVLVELASLAPESVLPVLDRSDALLAELGAANFRAWVLGGLRSAGDDPKRRLAFFNLTDPHAVALFAQAAADVTFADVERRLKLYLLALLGVRPVVRATIAKTGQSMQRRASFEGGFIRVPDTIRGARGADAIRVYRAMIAHVGAHLAFSRENFSVGSLKPMQIALVSLIEDARVEQLAIRQMPGLADLWRPFHVACPGSGFTAPALMARLSRALLDPSYGDDDPWVNKGKAMFFAARDEWDDNAISRRIGNLLGNDLGQMRVQFNPRTYAVEPLYRDDNSGLWDFAEAPREEMQATEDILLDSVRIKQTENPDDPHEREHQQWDDPMAARARPRAVDPDQGIPVAKYPEYDYVIGRDRPDWATIVEFEPSMLDAGPVDRLLHSHADLVRRIDALVGAARVSRPVRQRRRSEGDRLDMDACIRATVERRLGLPPEPRVYEVMERRNRDLSVLILLDVSESTNDFVRGSTTTVLTLERAATALLAHGMQRLGDPFAIHAFCSNGREEVRCLRVKDFAEPFDTPAKARLSSLRGGYSTRIGAGLRHAGATLASQWTHRRLVLVVTDGEPSDIDVRDRRYFVEDARKAVHSLARAGIDVFAIGLDGSGESCLARIFGRRNFVIIDDLMRLPERLPMLYLKLSA